LGVKTWDAALAMAHHDPVFEDKKRRVIDLDAWLDMAERRKDLKRQASLCQDEATITMPSRPLALVFSSDWHLGSPNVAYNAFREDLKFILDTPDMYVGFVGDLTDTYLHFKTLGPVVNQIMSPEEQKAVLQAVIERLMNKKKALFATWGNHDSEREERVLGYSPTAEMIAAHLPLFSGKGKVMLRVGGQEYIIWATHKSRFYTYMNPLHGAQQERRQYCPAADIAVTAHIHNPAFGMFTGQAWTNKRGSVTDEPPWAAIVTGSYKGGDVFSKRFWAPGRIGCPTVVLYPSERRLVLFPSPQEAAIYMRGLDAA
jgi:hypothetical protein